MTVSVRTTIVLGAGASKPFRFPLGSELLSDVVEMLSKTATDDTFRMVASATAHIARMDWNDVVGRLARSCVENIVRANPRSIDTFLERRREFEVLGKCAIAARLIPCESEPWLSRELSRRLWNQYPLPQPVDWKDDHWIDWVFHQMARDAESLQAFVRNGDRLKFVTFNYDRSLEHGFSLMLQGLYGVSPEEAEAAVKELGIVHVYGALGSYYRDEPTWRPYKGELKDADTIVRAATAIHLIGEDRAANGALEQARDYFRQSRRIVFLGFGFDPVNMERLAEGGAFHGCSFYASTLGLKKAELEESQRRYWPPAQTAPGDRKVRHSTCGETCLATLRELLGSL